MADGPLTRMPNSTVATAASEARCPTTSRSTRTPASMPPTKRASAVCVDRGSVRGSRVRSWLVSEQFPDLLDLGDGHASGQRQEQQDRPQRVFGVLRRLILHGLDR